MSLLTDSDVVTVADLAAVDPELSTIAETEDITLEGGILSEAWTESATEIAAATAPYDISSFSAADGNVGLTSIVVDSALKRWMLWKAVATFYRAAANRRDSDRYSAKLDRALEEVSRAWKTLFAGSVGVTASPLSCPGAAHEIASGYPWTGASATAGGSGGGITRVVCITYTGSDYADAPDILNSESGPSVERVVVIPANYYLSVSIATLVPPGSVDVQRGVPDNTQPRMTATGWNIYVGTVGGPKYLQNATPYPIATTSHTFSADPVISGYTLRDGQVPTSRTVLRRLALRG